MSDETVLGAAITYVPTIALGVALAASAGLRAWLPLLATGVLARFDVLQLGESFAFLESTPALIVFGVATLLEVAGDKIPVVDHGLDAVSTFVRPAAGALLTASVMWQVNDPMWAAALGIVIGAPVAAAPHIAKSATRAASTATTGGLANPIVSLIEDAVAALTIVLAVLLPILAVVLLAVAACFVVRFVRRRKHATVSA